MSPLSITAGRLAANSAADNESLTAERRPLCYSPCAGYAGSLYMRIIAAAGGGISAFSTDKSALL